jgi:hypothetical protein
MQIVNLSNLVFVFALICTSATAQQNKQLPNDRFAQQIGDLEPIQWKDFELIQKNVYTCMDDKKLEVPVCKNVRERMSYALYDALSQAHVINALVKPNEPRFCDEYGRKLILDRNLGQAAAYALLIVDERLKYGSSLYRAELSNTYLGKIVHDSLLESQPCKP